MDAMDDATRTRFNQRIEELNKNYPAPAPVYADEAYGYAPTCRRVWQPVYRSDGHYIRDRLVRVCR